ncbi:major capsid protein [Xanthomonas phage Mallos]|uniref:Major capsid protein n=1 Tax=Xanthomonas phage Mallos TaxID=2939131 RepID=A0A9E7E252_9CAUD|nr:major capsid protein [Xanthomonas phage Mallos]URA07134.1 major capsid protein [Xanthomonas phage Mallos]
MASVTLTESAKLAQDELVAGVIENVITVNEMFDLLPFDGIDGNALAYNRENVLGDVQVAGVGTTITAKNPATFTHVTSTLTTIIGDAEVNGLIQATRSGDGNDQTAVQVASKAKSAGRKYQDQLINGDGTGNTFTGLLGLAAAGQTIGANNGAANGAALSFEDLDALIDLVTDKDGQVDYIMMHGRTRRKYLALLRALGGTSPGDIYTMPSGRQVPAYRGIPIFRNDWIPINQTQGTSVNATSVFAGTFDDGSRTHGIAGLTAATEAGVKIKYVGEKEDADESITRITWYCGLALFSEKGLAVLEGVTP